MIIKNHFTGKNEAASDKQDHIKHVNLKKVFREENILGPTEKTRV